MSHHPLVAMVICLHRHFCFVSQSASPHFGIFSFRHFFTLAFFHFGIFSLQHLFTSASLHFSIYSLQHLFTSASFHFSIFSLWHLFTLLGHPFTLLRHLFTLASFSLHLSWHRAAILSCHLSRLLHRLLKKRLN